MGTDAKLKIKTYNLSFFMITVKLTLWSRKLPATILTKLPGPNFNPMKCPLCKIKFWNRPVNYIN